MTDQNEKMTAEKDAIVEAALIHVPFDGWSWKALEAAAGNCGLAAAVARRDFPAGLTEAAEHLSDWADRRMTAALEGMDMDSMPVRERLAAGIRARLEIFRFHREAVRRISTFLSLPGHKGMALKLTWKTVDAVWCKADDGSHDLGHYAKRGLLAPIYVTTVLYWFTDSSDGFEDTWDYLDRRIAGMFKIPEAKVRLDKCMGKIPSPFRFCRRLLRLKECVNNGTARL